ncbi:hypothetical protein GCM10010517_09080 [Streptosporangium fragile]|uniref:Uncharacterized protein n=1 Tax=Streptosporangium fragile TaxID=46186 RepID=A0ABP6I7G2_9ACTN
MQIVFLRFGAYHDGGSGLIHKASTRGRAGRGEVAGNEFIRWITAGFSGCFPRRASGGARRAVNLSGAPAAKGFR